PEDRLRQRRQDRQDRPQERHDPAPGSRRRRLRNGRRVRRLRPPGKHDPSWVRSVDGLELERDGAQLHRGVLDPASTAKLRTLADAAVGPRPGARLTAQDDLKALLAATGPVGAVAASALGTKSRPVRAVMLDKSAASNWAVGWHQDRTIAVRERT